MPNKLYSCSQLDLHPCLRVSLFFVSERQHIDLYWVFSWICSKHIFWGMCGWPCVHCRLPMSDMSIGVHSLGQWVPQMRSRQLQSMCCRHKTAGPSASCVEMGSTWRTQHAHSIPRAVSNVPLQAIVYLVRVAMWLLLSLHNCLASVSHASTPVQPVRKHRTTVLHASAKNKAQQ